MKRYEWIFIGLWTLAVLTFAALRWHFFAYAHLDLGIFDQVLWNSVHGRWYQFTFNEASYLVDHRSWLLSALVPVYAMIAHPLVLVVAQVAGVLTGLIPFLRIVERLLGGHTWFKRNRWAAILAYLLYPTMTGMVLYEFHMLAFLVPLSFWLWWCVLAHKRFWFWICAALILLLREDAGLVLIGLGVLLMIYQPRWRRDGVVLLILSSAWTIAMLQLGAVFSVQDTALFSTFYAWAGDSFGSAAVYMLTHPFHTMRIAFGGDHLLTPLLFLAASGGLALLRSRYLMPTILPFALFLLADRSLSIDVVIFHYGAFFAPWFLIAGIYGLQYMLDAAGNERSWKLYGAPLVTSAVVAAYLFCNPWLHSITALAEAGQTPRAAYAELLSVIEEDDRVVVGSRFWPYVTQREGVYPLKHLLSGTYHLSDTPYPVPEDIDWLILEYPVDYELDVLYPERLSGIAERLQSIVEESQLHYYAAAEGMMLYGRSDRIDLTAFDSPRELQAGEQELVFTIELPDEGIDASDVLPVIEIAWKQRNGFVTKRHHIPLGQRMQDISTLEPGSSVVLSIPVYHPASAVSAQVHIGSLELVRHQYPFFFPLHYRVSPEVSYMLDADSAETQVFKIPLTSMGAAGVSR